ncbi:polyprenyl synthetase family protein [Deinococcus lacus]|uniref:Polyprenyl synthetase family protein n=1 Tax=Deinococcus lacus TaxID=392561 RepID=A0ABW1Y930_9DEIO
MRPELLDRMLSLLPQQGTRPELAQMLDMLHDYPRRGGKGVRSELLLLSAQAHGVQPGSPEWEQALWLAAALELFQNWVLIHDDIADDSEERRGRPALHRLHGIPLALNAGDALHAYMWAAVARADVPGALDEFLTMIHRTAEGQHLDLYWVEHGEWNLQEEDYLEMVRLKTGFYTVVTPLRLGALAASRTPHPEFTGAGLALGTAFQIRDDVLNLTGDPVKYGKEIGGDLAEGKRTLVTLHWLAHAGETQRHVFLDQMRRARPDKSPEVLDDILQWFRASGSVDYAQAYADAEAQRGLELLHCALEEAGTQSAALIRVVETLAQREA